MRGRPVRVPRPIKWLMVLLALAAGWAAGNLLDEAKAARGVHEPAPHPHPTSGPAVR